MANLRVLQAHLRTQLQEAIAAADEIRSGSDDSVTRTAYETWDKRNEILLDRAFEKKGFLDVTPKDDYTSALGLTYPFGPAMSDSVTHAGLVEDLDAKVVRLQQILDTLDVYGGSESTDVVENYSPTVFIVHGRADAPRLEIELLVRRATKLEPVVLLDQVNKGATLIEKLEEHLGPKSTSFAVVVMTGDDVGALKGEEKLEPRARQNVILELGFAMGALGRRRVAILHESGLELPSDIAGVAYYPLDSSGAWKARLLGELQAAGLEVDANALL